MLDLVSQYGEPFLITPGVTPRTVGPVPDQGGTTANLVSVGVRQQAQKLTTGELSPFPICFLVTSAREKCLLPTPTPNPMPEVGGRAGFGVIRVEELSLIPTRGNI